MLLLPGLVLIAAISLGSFSIALERIELEVSAFQLSREIAIGLNPNLPEGVTLEIETEGRLSCAHLVKPGLITLSARHCMIRYGG
jgi:hypothetical protein